MDGAWGLTRVCLLSEIYKKFRDRFDDERAWKGLPKGQDGGEDEEGFHRVYGSTLNETRCESDDAQEIPPSSYAIFER